MSYLVFAKLWQLVSKGKTRSVAEQIRQETQLSQELLATLAGLSMQEKIELLQAREQIFSTQSWMQFIQLLLEDGFIQKLTQQVKLNSSNLPIENIGLLSCFSPTDVIAELMELLAAKNEFIRFEAAATLIAINDPLVVKSLIKVLNQPKKWIPARLMDIFLNYGESAVHELLNAFEQADKKSRILILDMLSKMADPSAEKLFSECLKDDDPQVRGLGIVGLGQLGKGLESLPTMIKDQDASVRLKALQLVDNLQDPAVQNYYWIALRDENWLVRSFAAEALIDKGLLPIQAMEKIRASADNPDILTEVFGLVGELNQEGFIWKR